MTSSQNKKSGFIKTYHEIPPIRQHAEFCQRNPQECRLANGNGRMKLTKIRWRQLVSINKWVNKNIIYTPEKGDVWGYPKRVYYYHRGKFRFKYKGDCEEYVILKRHKLIKKGWPASSLLITVVWDENGEGHAVLTARTAQGDYVLDNKSSKVKKWNKVPYKFRKMQSHRNPRQWVSLRPRLKVGM
ncbi:MAG: transglutaminase-like cysteine peptidase [Alphaproteobacteria bacterium]|nr:transglutaminase-like cysteine peptidase [Alphaproteobacteria bacterium]MDD9920314.1 transglutaminase-like cysteine peptidase [Alphaproteobacteria bacterium]